MKIILVENEKEVEALYKKFGKSEEFKWIILSPFAIPELEKLNIKYDVIDNYYDDDELWRVTGWNSYKRVTELVKFVDSLIKENVEEFKNIDILNCYKHQLVILFDGIIARIFMLRNLLEKLKPAQVYMCKRNPQPFSGYGYLFNQNDTAWAACLSLKGWEFKINFTLLDEVIVEDAIRTKMKLKNLIKKNQILSRLIKEYRSLQRFGITDYIKNRYSKKTLLLLYPEYEWAKTIATFSKNGFFIKTESVDDLKNTKPETRFLPKALNLMNNLVRRDEFREKFSYGNIDFYPPLKSRVEKMVCEGMTKGISIYNKAEKYIENFHPKAVLFSIAPYPEYWFLLQSFKKHRTPIICWQHASEEFFDNRGAPETELLYTDYYFIYGEGVSRTYSKYKNEYNFQPLSIGSSTVDRLANTEKLGNYILYATTNYYQNKHHFAVFHTYLDIKIYVTQKKILSYFETLKNQKVVFKLHPNVSFRTPPMKITNPNIEIVRNENSFVELLGGAKIIVLDCPATTLIQAGTTKKPIFALTSFLKFKPRALDLLKKRAVCSESPEELVGILDDYLKTGNYSADVNNREFLKEYGTYLDDGKSAERAVNKVIEITESE